MQKKYTMLNVLNNPVPSWQNENAVDQVVAMLSCAGNRSARRRAEKALTKTASIHEHCEKAANKRANDELQKKVDNDLIWICAAVGLTLYEDYHWKEDPENDHGQITSFLERMTKRMYKLVDEGKNVDEISKELFDKTGIQLV